MLKMFKKFVYMAGLGSKYIKIYKKTYYHPFISKRAAYKQLSLDRQAYSNSILKYLNIEIELIGDVPKQDKLLYAINHRSLLDIIVMESIFSKHDKNGIWIAKEELFTAFYGDFFKYSGCLSVDVENKKGLLKFFKELKYILSRVDDINIYIFPEGKRNRDNGIIEFQSGASKIAQANKLDVVPVYINDTLETVFKDAPYKKTKVVKVNIGELINGSDLREKYTEFMNMIKEK